MTTSSNPVMPELTRTARRLGYSIAAAVNLVMIWVVHNIVGWDGFGWLTTEFSQLLPWLTISFVVGAGLNLAYIRDDSVPVKSTGQIASAAIGLTVTLQTLRVFPFDFSSYDFDYAIAIRVALWVAVVGILFGIGGEINKLRSYEPGAR